ncbi:toll/interleukin-1 receptor domain-containing protein [Sphingomonas sp. G124]|uniref:Toll/interleukin-1 receptor domain-containing protein n=1 Tax=Sphingomonas cremea TaxID=2904799 RepID=A0A9X1QHM4_9SPHN|nr:toll/interleukin-1 receptor domain-containing protein [Sphingomonas cremea]MCF2513868.1 toll/interleukin-1 receptor domain-containing protein [Sphingomonas cremea]
MRIIDKINLIDNIGRELQSRFTYEEINGFLAEFAVSPPQNVTVNSKWIYVKTALRGVATETILKIADELGMEVSASPTSASLPPENWQDTKLFRLFISHISKDAQKATRLKEALVPFGIDAFVAHEDIHPTLEWQSEIERALRTMDGFIAMLTEGFSQSNWTQQEVGFAFGRGAKVISFKMEDEDPTGFISKQQALPRRGRNADAIAAEIEMILAKDERTSGRLAEAKKALKGEEPDEDLPF